MLDLIYVNAIAVLFDILVVILLYLNRIGISHPVQVFSYTLKLQLEFVVLNQLMAVAARGLHKEPFEERRYHHSSAYDAFSAECRQWDKAPVGQLSEHDDSHQDSPRKSQSIDSTQLSVPEPVMSRSNQPRQSTTDSGLYSGDNTDKTVLGDEQKLRQENFLDDDSASSRAEESEETRPGLPGSHIYSQRLRGTKNKALRSVYRFGNDLSQDRGDRRQRKKATETRHMPRRGRYSGEDEEEISVHMWEHYVKPRMETAWFTSQVDA